MITGLLGLADPAQFIVKPDGSNLICLREY